MQLPIPTARAVREAARSFIADEPTAALHGAVRLAALTWPENTDLAAVTAKVLLIDRAFGTHVYDPHAMASRIVALRIDPSLVAGDPDLVEGIATPAAPKGKRAFSFATKYCAAHRPDDYQIFDSHVERAVWMYQRQLRFGEFRRTDLWTYSGFARVIEAFRDRFGLRDRSRVDVDRFLWTVGQELAG